jgi:hypothetical protein
MLTFQNCDSRVRLEVHHITPQVGLATALKIISSLSVGSVIARSIRN